MTTLSSVKKLFACLALACLSGCGGSNNDDEGVVDTGQDARVAQMRFINAMPDAPLLQMTHNGRNSTLVTELLIFGAGSRRNDFVTGTFSFNFGYLDGTGEVVVLYEASDVVVDDGDEFTYVMIGSLANPELLRIENAEFLLGLDDATAVVDPEIQFVHTVVGRGAIDFYLSSDDADISGAIPNATLEFGEYSDIASVVAGTDYRIRAFTAGTTTNPLFDSDSTALAATTRTLILAANFFGPGISAGSGEINLLRFGILPEAFENLDSPNTFRVRNAIADADSVDVYFDNVLGAPVVADLVFGAVSTAQPDTGRDLSILVTPAGDSVTIGLQTAATLLPGQRHTLYLGGLISDEADNGAANVGSFLAAESFREISSGVSVRVFNGSSVNSGLNVYFLSPGQTIDTGTPITVAMGDYNTITLGSTDYDLTIVEVINQATIYGPERITLTPSTVLTTIIRDTLGGGSPVVVDFTEEPTVGIN